MIILQIGKQSILGTSQNRTLINILLDALCSNLLWSDLVLIEQFEQRLLHFSSIIYRFLVRKCARLKHGAVLCKVD